MTHPYDLPNPQRSDARMRRIGLEFEFAGLTLDQSAAVLLDTLGGERTESSAAQQVIQVDELGEFHVEVDWELLKQLASESAASEQMLNRLADTATVVVPVEIVCPPLAPSVLPKIDRLVENLRQAGAKGTEHSVFYAFGLHINVELPDTDPATLDRYLKAYALLQSYLVEEQAIDMSRRVTPYFDLFPDAYLLQVLRRDSPDINELMEDYLRYNPTRDRALDLLPIFAHLNESAVQDRLNDPRIKARPAFHYRLPDCRINEAGWTPAAPLQLWCVVENLAADADRLRELRALALDNSGGVPGILGSKWADEVRAWLE